LKNIGTLRWEVCHPYALAAFTSQEIFPELASVRGTGRIISMKNSNDIIGNRTRDLPACSAVPQPIFRNSVNLKTKMTGG
jgi:hypothetical protein